MVGCSTDPEFYKKTRAENFNLNDDLEDIFKSYDNLVSLLSPLLRTTPQHHTHIHIQYLTRPYTLGLLGSCRLDQPFHFVDSRHQDS